MLTRSKTAHREYVNFKVLDSTVCTDFRRSHYRNPHYMLTLLASVYHYFSKKGSEVLWAVMLMSLLANKKLHDRPNL